MDVGVGGGIPHHTPDHELAGVDVVRSGLAAAGATDVAAEQPLLNDYRKVRLLRDVYLRAGPVANCARSGQHRAPLGLRQKAQEVDAIGDAGIRSAHPMALGIVPRPAEAGSHHNWLTYE